MLPLPPSWDLSALYSSIDDPAFEKDLSVASLQADRFRLLGENKIADLTPENFGKMLLDYDRLIGKTGKLNAFAEMTYTADMNVEANVAFYEKTNRDTDAILQKVDFFEKETANLSDEKTAELMTNPTVQRYALWIDKLRSNKTPDFDEKTKELLEANKNRTSEALRLYDKTKNELQFKVDGKTASSNDLYSLSYSANPDDRRKAGLALNDGYKNKSAIFSKIVNTIVQSKKYADEQYGYKTPIEARNRSNQIENGIVDALVSSVDKAAPDVSHRYYALKAKWIGQEKIGYWDRNAPVAGVSPRRYTFDEAKDIVLSSYREFDPEMGEIAEKFFEEKRIDAAPRSGKQPGEYAMPIIDGKAYISMNFNGTTNDVLALAHELGHGIHYELSKKNGALGTQMPITMEETASIFGEMLTFDKMLQKEKNPEQRFALLSDKMNRVMLTTFRQVALHHYEEDMHNGVREKGAVSAADLNAIWTKAQSNALGPSVINDEQTSSSWADVPHLLRTPFYVYGYAFGECLTSSLYQVYKDGTVKDFPNKYKEMLSKGSTEQCADLLKPFGLDVSKPDFWKQGLGTMKGYVDKLERLTDTLGMDKTKKNALPAVALTQSKTAGR